MPIRIFEVVVMGLKESKPELRLKAIRRLGAVDDPRAAEALIRIIQDPNSDDHTRYEAMDALSKRRDAFTVEALVSALNNPAGLLRGYVAWTLGRLGNPLAVDALISHLDDAESDLGLSEEDYREVFWHLGSGIGNGNCAYGALKSLGKRAVPKLLEYLNSAQATGNRNYIHVIDVLGDIGDPRAATTLEQLSKDLDDNIRLNREPEHRLQSELIAKSARTAIKKIEANTNRHV